ncbi:MAG TPA: HAMP domain-containing sensor histidine kinase [Thermoanaerobaculia bacterium]|jgi:signal transduction histidine kinase|nr:HAMP domain-containing sensor histidine kinase [Thermoanaerobaculia bacterium]
MDTPPTPMTPSPSFATDGVALFCAPDGAVRRVARNTLDGATIGATLCGSVDDASAEACHVFISAIARAGLARSTPLRIGTRDVHCFGLRDGETFVIAGVIDPATAAAFAESVEGFTRLADEIRRTHSTYQLYEQLASANNDLVTAQRELARTIAELQRLNAYKDELLGMAAHDLRNPLNANAAFIAFLLHDSESFGDDAKTLLERLHTNSEYMLRLVDDVLDFAAIQSGRVRLQLEDVTLEPIVASVVETMRIIAEGKRVRVAYTVEGELPPLRLDRIKITQAVQNLVANAVQYSPPGESVDVRLRSCRGGVELEVEDRGPGIPPEELPQLFKPFTRLSTVALTNQRSVGLGLAITRRLVEAHGGTIDVRSEVGKGSVFTARLRA